MLQAETPSSHSRARLSRAGGWFLQSGILERTGGAARYYRSDVQQNAPVSTEITGYAVSTLCYLYERAGDVSYLDAARKAGDFLVHVAWDRSLQIFPFEHGGNDTLAYFFDSGIIVRGLLYLSRLTGEGQYEEIAIAAGESMGRDFIGSDGVIHPIVELPQKTALPHTPQWSRSPGCYQLKSALAWHDLWDATDDPKWRTLYESALGQTFAAKDSFLPAETPEKTMDRLHAYLYFLEGMFPCADRANVREALAEGIDHVVEYLRAIAPRFVRSDVYAQLLRVRLLAETLAGVRLDEVPAAEEAARIAEFQLDGPDPRIDKGFCFGRKNGELLPYVNPVSTAFCLQALDMWQDGAAVQRRWLI